MPKSSQAETQHRVAEVLRLVLAGAEFPEVRQFAKQQGWKVSDRQLRRYMEAAYRQLAQLSDQDADQLKGRHLMQRRALYARALKGGDLRTALVILQDEAKLEGLYPPTKIAPTTPDGTQPYSPIALSERLPRLITAHSEGNEQEVLLLEQASPKLHFAVPDTLLPLNKLNVMALIYVNEQLEQAGQLLHAFFMIDRDDDEFWNAIATTAAYRFRSGKLAWEEFTAEIGIDGDALVRANYQGMLRELCSENICNITPSREVVQAVCDLDQITCVADLVDGWRQIQVGKL